MTKFKFRLQKVLEFRRTQENTAKTDYLETRARRIESEFELQNLTITRNTRLQQINSSLEQRHALHSYISRLEDQERAQHSVIGVLSDEEEKARQNWIEARKAAEALQTLKDNEYEEYQKEADRQEQAALDEWAVLRRTA